MSQGHQDLRFHALSRFYSAPGPWHPSGVFQPHPDAYNSGAFHDYRNTSLPSDCGTTPGDSGYGGTRSTYSLVESAPSIADNDRGTEPSYLEAQATLIGDLSIDATASIYQPSQISHPQAASAEFRCDQCGNVCKTKSELKPYKCTYESCPKAELGFSTPNDLARHKKTVHREHNENDPIYVCRHGTCARKKEKLWPRADNFRSHLFRSHQITVKADHDLREYRHKSGAAKPHGLRDERRSATSVNPGRRPMQLQDASLAHNLRPNDDLKNYHFQPEAPELHALRGVGSSVADVDPGPRPAQLQDSPDLRGDQVSTTASGRVQDDSSKQSSLPPILTRLPGGDNPQLMQSNGLEDPKSHAIVDLTSPDEIFLGDSEDILPHDEVVLDSFDHAEDNVMADEELLDCPEPSTFQIDSPRASAQPEASAPQDDIPKILNMTEEPRNALGTSAEAPSDTLTLDSPKSPELFPFSKDALLDMAAGDGRANILSFLRNLPKDLLEKALKSEDQTGGGSDHSIDQGEHQKPETCKECGKTFSRKCELRKHMKRHEKPYGCTYKTCHKMFGSKNDWKRHESSQHFQLETWNCNFLGCDKVLPRRELFKTHLIKHHKLQHNQQIETLQETCRLGRHCDRRFWCGFCDKFVEIEGEVVNSWTKRCDHIDNHLFGKEGLQKKTMNDWNYLEDKLKEGDPEDKLAEGSSKATKKRKATEDMSSRPVKKNDTSWFSWNCICKRTNEAHRDGIGWDG
ncbi:uncharacterized protein TRIVIDRAFT_63605 [Trichoderma virens Gv29-8]|uniref:C2H2-type domain-containing protein n=1 Tax=Hypocrea virens (strain Gv29-8 / FGSC 10586) TaxID=413071 RepID=G9MHU7_HYPVG|nr:uncharacterized protein TRIVIDRAFT_63605 [Trichoderma virens Gv29-8]EHK26284.1 hypothetical protein TRIVIDRAFT_63605 [Trichoderma virens Gv29-8]UKZ46467.1 hypothetical protein TrVGV298_000670 [Trichoderma virens]